MKAFVIDKFKSEGAVRELPEPALEAGTVLVRIHLAGVNPVDWKVRDGESGERRFPLVLGQDFAGTVLAVGTGVTRVHPGDRVFGCARAHGSYAEETLVHDGEADSPFTLIPQGVTDEQAAALPTPALTALASLEALKVQSGTSLLVVGAGGAVGGAAVQMAHARGARVTAFVRRGQEAAARQAGADVVVASDGDMLTALINEHAGPFDAMLDLVSAGYTLKSSSRLLNKGGRLVSTIHAADEAWFAENGFVALNIVMNKTPQSSPRGLDDLASMVIDGTLTVNVSEERGLIDAGHMLDELKAGTASGKMLVRMM